MKRYAIIGALVLIVVLPFLLRPKQAPLAAAQDVLVIVTPHNEAIRHEFAVGFERWYRAQTGRTVAVDWRVLGGTSEISLYLEGQYVAAFQNYWTHALGRPWSLAVLAGFQSPRLAADAPTVAREARAAFLDSAVGCGIDVFFGGGAFDFDRQADAGRLGVSTVRRRHPDWFTDAIMPISYAGEQFRDPADRWFGCVVSSYGIVYNRDALRHLGFTRPPAQWDDLADPRFLGEVALCDPTKSGSIAQAFENLVQQHMQRALRAAAPGPVAEREAAAVRAGWIDGLQLIQRIGADARYFTDTSQKPPIDVADGNCAAGMCIDFYGNQQAEAVRRRGDSERLGFASPAGGTAYSVDPVAILRGAPHRELAERFVDFVLSPDGQKLWDFRPGTPGGPVEFALRRLPVRKDFYARADWTRWRSDPDFDPYAGKDLLVYRPEWTGPVFQELAFIIRVMCQDTHEDLVAAWRAILAAPEPARARALAILQDVSFVDYDQARGPIKAALGSKNKVGQIRLANELAQRFRAQYARARAVAVGSP